MMEFTPIRPIKPLFEPLTAQPGLQGAQNTGTSLFASVFQSAIANVRETSAVKSDLEYKLATGQLDNPAEYNVAATKAGNATLLLMEMRNKALDAYNEMIRISL